MRWVRDNIGAFGGDARRVTLVGFSAGAASVGLHLVSPLSQGLFQRAILVSGSPLAAWAHMEAREARRVGQELAAIMGCRSGSDQESVRCLQDRDFTRLLTAAQRILEVCICHMIKYLLICVPYSVAAKTSIFMALHHRIEFIGLSFGFILIKYCLCFIRVITQDCPTVCVVPYP